jgi:hypothetical protein
MKKEEKYLNIIKWTARIIAAGVILFGLPFYFGYGNPLPFINPDYKFFDNLWLTIFPLMFIGLGLGWKFEKIGGYIVTISLSIGLIATLIMEKELIWFMLIPLASGILYLIHAYKR